MNNQDTLLRTYFLPPKGSPDNTSSWDLQVQAQEPMRDILQPNCTSLQWEEMGNEWQGGEAEKETAFQNLLTGGAEGANEKTPAFPELLLRSRTRH